MNKLYTLLNTLRLYIREDRVSGLLVFIFFITPLAISPYGLDNFIIIKYAIVGISAVILSLLFYKESGSVFRVNKSLFFILITFVLGLFSVTFSSANIYISFIGNANRLTSSFLFLFSWVMILFVLLNTNARKAQNTYIVLASVSAALLNALFAIFQTFIIPYQIRVSSLLGNANFTAMYLAVTIPFWYLVYHRANNLFQKRLVLIGVFICGFALLILSSRGALLGLLSGVIVFLILKILDPSKSKKYLLYFFIILVSMCLVFYFYLLIIRPGSLSFSDKNITDRFLVWDNTVSSIKKSPVLGTGLGNFEANYLQTRPGFLSSSNYQYDDPHNVFLLLAEEGGLVVFVSFIGLLGLALFYAIKEYLSTYDNFKLALILGVVIWCVSASFTPVEPTNWLLLAFLLGNCFEQSLFVKSQFKPSLLFVVVAYVFFTFSLFVSIGAVLAEPINEISVSYFEKKEFVKSKRLGKIAIILNPFKEKSYLTFFGSSLALKEPFESFKGQVRQYQKFHQHNFRMHRNVAVINYWMFILTQDISYSNKVIEEYNLAINSNPGDSSIKQELASYYFIIGDDESAKRLTIENIVHSFSDKQLISSYGLLARLYQDQGRYDQMLYSLEKIRKLDPENLQFKYFFENVRKDPSAVIVSLPVTFTPTLY